MLCVLEYLLGGVVVVSSVDVISYGVSLCVDGTTGGVFETIEQVLVKGRRRRSPAERSGLGGGRRGHGRVCLLFGKCVPLCCIGGRCDIEGGAGATRRKWCLEGLQ